MSTAEHALRVDAHHHLWRYTAADFEWLSGELTPLRRDFPVDELLADMRSAGVTAAVAVQARQTDDETRWLLDIANVTPAIAGVVGWLPLASGDFAHRLRQFETEGKLKGLRHVVQAEHAGFLDGDAFNRGTRALLGTGLVYDLLVLQHQLPEAIRFVDRHPSQQFVVDHLAKPLVRAGEMEPWATHLRELARRPHVVCKLSGMVTEAGAGWTGPQLEPYFHAALEAFGPYRIMVGSDWPVLTAHCSYEGWWCLVERWLQPLTGPEQAAMLGGTAQQVYGLTLPANSPRLFTSVPGSM